ncbi:helix-turn-helix domain-containing protein [Rhodococcus rhodnii]|uniref:Excisionase n=2 Tax=Rhodococcus rhodnii TaxID=38312 RepID=R7WPH6_9NOCA|nr:helix-turn-helix domain-containing protein [Rhodococcus rhodnii]EOM77213.1 excisionase [Rhodococcus rhodnii LMG 5362]TXG91975.1 helix-turn-helix domain-containing protein [Rhodococcus rhodnii]
MTSGKKPLVDTTRGASSDGGSTVSGPQFLTVAEVASLMRVSKMTVYRLVHSGELPAVRVGRSFRVHAKAVHDYLETSYFDAG